MKNEFTKQPFHYQASFKQHRSATLPASGCLKMSLILQITAKNKEKLQKDWCNSNVKKETFGRNLEQNSVSNGPKCIFILVQTLRYCFVIQACEENAVKKPYFMFLGKSNRFALQHLASIVTSSVHFKQKCNCFSNPIQMSNQQVFQTNIYSQTNICQTNIYRCQTNRFFVRKLWQMLRNTRKATHSISRLGNQSGEEFTSICAVLTIYFVNYICM